MIFNITGGGGGTALNFRVVGGTTAPTNPQENTIWVNTSVDITGWEFSSVQPSSPEAGMVWFATGTSSSVAFNALKKNSIQVYPTSSKQYVSGTWVNVIALSYQGGIWVDWKTYIYNSGIANYDFIAVAKKVDASHSYAVAPTITQNEGNMAITEAGGAFNAGIVYADPSIDLSKYSKVGVSYATTNYDTSADIIKLRAYTSIGSYHDDNSAADVLLSSSATTATLDVSNLSGNYVLAFSLVNHPNAGTGDMILTIYDWWLE